MAACIFLHAYPMFVAHVTLPAAAQVVARLSRIVVSIQRAKTQTVECVVDKYWDIHDTVTSIYI